MRSTDPPFEFGDQATGSPTTTLLRRYRVAPGRWGLFLDVWRRIVEVRERHGFKVLFALVDEEMNMFTWAIRYTGDLDEAAARYYSDPDRVELEIVNDYVVDYEVRPVRPLELR